jgi:hypothetical protein
MINQHPTAEDAAHDLAMSQTATEFSRTQFDHAYPDGIENNYWNVARNWIVAREMSLRIERA